MRGGKTCYKFVMNLGKYKYTLIFISSIVIAIVLFVSGSFEKIIDSLDGFGYVSAFIAGLGFSVSFSTAPASLFFVNLGEHYNPFAIAVIGGLGAMVSDLLLYKFIKDDLFDEVKAIFLALLPPFHREKLEQFTKHRFFVWTVPLLASMLIASPLPDEIGIALFSVVNFKPRYLSVITFTLNTIGIFILVMVGYALVK